jgi:hypothetical protein
MTVQPAYVPRPEIITQADGRDLIVYDGIVVGEIELRHDALDGEHRRIVFGVHPINHSGKGRTLHTSFVLHGGIRFSSEAEYDAWINKDDREAV